MKILDILKEDTLADRRNPGYYTMGDSHARAVGIGDPWDHSLSFNGVSSAEENWGANIPATVPKGSVLVISFGANDVVKNPNDSPEKIADRIKKIVDISNSRDNKTIVLLFPAGPTSNKFYQRRVEVRKAIDNAVHGDGAVTLDLEGAPLQKDGVHATLPTYGTIAKDIVSSYKPNPKYNISDIRPGQGDKKDQDKKDQDKKDQDKTNTDPSKTTDQKQQDQKQQDQKQQDQTSVNNPGVGAPLKGALIVNSPYGTRNGKPHYGVDLKAASGTALLSPIDGKIMKAGEEGACGGSITVLSADGKEQHRFCHIKKFNVSVGQEVKAGDVIGLTGGANGDPMAGNATGPNLHWEKKINGSLVDPMKGSMTPGQGGRMTPSVQSKTGTISSSAVSDYLKSKGIDDIHRVAILANIQGESSFEPGVLRTDRNGLPSGGLFQHNGPRYSAMTKAVPDWQTNWQGQVDFALSEPAAQQFLNTNYKTVNDAVADWLDKFEITADPIGDLSKRTKFASQFA